MIINFNNLKELLCFNIKYYRYLNNLSQERLAELSHLSPRYITDIETGRHCPSIQKIESISKALKIKPYMLFKNTKRDKDIVKKINETRQYNSV